MILAQAMLFFPIAAGIVFVVAFATTFTVISFVNLMVRWIKGNRSMGVSLGSMGFTVWTSLGVAVVVLTIFVLKVWTYEGPWITLR